MKYYETLILYLLLIASSIATVFWIDTCRSSVGDDTQVKRDTVFITDTVIGKPIEVHDTLLKCKTIYLPSIASETDIDTTQLTMKDDSLYIPITQKEYSDDSTYTAWVSGYEPNLDSIHVYQRTVIINNTKTVTKRRMMNFGLQFGAGYGLFSKSPDVYIGGGVTITLP